MIYHVHFTCAADSMARRVPFRPAHLAQLSSLRADGRVVAGGPEPDGTAANIFYRVADRPALDRLLAENEFYRTDLFTGHVARAFGDFLQPLELPPIDTGLPVTLVEGRPVDRTLGRKTLVELQQQGRAAFGGFFDDGSALVAVRTASSEEALAWLTAGGSWDPARLTGRAWSQTLRSGRRARQPSRSL